jgi:O-acetyl-ADP-ribose deacetylase (regulator of RNase III)
VTAPPRLPAVADGIVPVLVVVVGNGGVAMCVPEAWGPTTCDRVPLVVRVGVAARAAGTCAVTPRRALSFAAAE